MAEIGNNHEGSFEAAQEMIECAARAGADAVKFQTFIPEYISAGDSGRLERLRTFQLSHRQFEELARVARESNIIFFSTPFDPESASFLNEIQPVFKVASSDNTHSPLITQIARFGKPIILSTGMALISEICAAENWIRSIWGSQGQEALDLALLHCVSSYPVPADQANLLAIKTLSEEFPEAIPGYSDHTVGINAAVASVGLGAKVLEKHFTLDKQFSDFRDHQLSADPADLAELVARVRELEEMLGDGEKKMQPAEEQLLPLLRRSAAASAPLKKGARIGPADLIWVRPGDGVCWDDREQIEGRLLRRDLQFAEVISLDDLV